MPEFNTFLKENFGISVSKLVVMLVLATGLYFGMEARLDALTKDVQSALAGTTQVSLDLKETNKELAKLREALVEVSTEIRVTRREQKR